MLRQGNAYKTETQKTLNRMILFCKENIYHIHYNVLNGVRLR